MATGALAERVVHGVGARRAGPDWTARRIRGTTAGTGSVCRSSRRSRGSRKPLRALTPRLSPPGTLPERAAPRQRRGCGRCRSRGRKRARPPELAKPRRRGFAQRPQLHCCCWYFNLNELNDGPEDRQVSRFAQFYATADTFPAAPRRQRPRTARLLRNLGPGGGSAVEHPGSAGCGRSRAAEPRRVVRRAPRGRADRAPGHRSQRVDAATLSNGSRHSRWSSGPGGWPPSRRSRRRAPAMSARAARPLKNSAASGASAHPLGRARGAAGRRRRGDRCRSGGWRGRALPELGFGVDRGGLRTPPRGA